jgi:hypothetical protein
MKDWSVLMISFEVRRKLPTQATVKQLAQGYSRSLIDKLKLTQSYLATHRRCIGSGGVN